MVIKVTPVIQDRLKSILWDRLLPRCEPNIMARVVEIKEKAITKKGFMEASPTPKPTAKPSRLQAMAMVAASLGVNILRWEVWRTSGFTPRLRLNSMSKILKWISLKERLLFFK